MKLRIKGDSLRLRLTRSEVDQLSADSQISVDTHFADATLSYTLRTDPGEKQLSASLRDNRLTIMLPESQVQSWAATDQVSLRGQHGPLQILVEKDFSCLQPREGEDDSDAFPHPNHVGDFTVSDGQKT